VFGHGVSFMESQIKWHYLPMDEAQYSQALQDIEALRR
jgi:transketolase